MYTIKPNSLIAKATFENGIKKTNVGAVGGYCALRWFITATSKSRQRHRTLDFENNGRDHLQVSGNSSDISNKVSGPDSCNLADRDRRNKNNRKFAPSSIRYLHNVTKPRFRFTVAEAYCPKKRYEYDHQERTPRDSRNDILGGRLGRAHTGEDSFFIKEWTSDGPLKGSLAFAVADGVGGWAAIGVNPSKFSHGLCERMASEFKRTEDALSLQDPNSETYHDDRTTTASPQSLLTSAYKSLKDEGDSYAGGSTACVGVASAFTGMLSIANIGDSGFFIFRQRRVYRRSTPQTHQFNTPFQLSIVPKSMAKRRGRSPISDDPQDADLSQHQLKHGDVVVLATDGLTDNVFAQEILKVVTNGMWHSRSWIHEDEAAIDDLEPVDLQAGAQEIAQNLVRAGINASLDPNSESPFTLRLRQEMGFVAPGGKPDDITVLVMLVEELNHDGDGL
ncbi:type 2C protein phosphatase PTC7 [Sugiyamaella lignohabitans]|uniref:Protein phosphatase n=1 Tax=Sugiyamaella lignohabitans TaxID=796027 RepID=A0A167FCR3_9ASCO|nr:type 2C protein phosphatase PTC7 [Sugiyamaella lignohabitans]ANB15126.1 type 2C protein phosphatase PTC7 [Sugiyamaella lignohabitans]